MFHNPELYEHLKAATKEVSDLLESLVYKFQTDESTKERGTIEECHEVLRELRLGGEIPFKYLSDIPSLKSCAEHLTKDVGINEVMKIMGFWIGNVTQPGRSALNLRDYQNLRELLQNIKEDVEINEVVVNEDTKKMLQRRIKNLFKKDIEINEGAVNEDTKKWLQLLIDVYTSLAAKIKVQSLIKEYLNVESFYPVSVTEEWFEEQDCKKYEDPKRRDREIDRMRKSKKCNFWMNPGIIKLSTIHSFKGWEVPTLFLIIDSDNESDGLMPDELIYTAITRCRVKLYILNINNTKYHKFFTKNDDALSRFSLTIQKKLF